MDLLNNHPGDLPRVAAALARLQQRHRTTSDREVEARRAEHDRRAAEALEAARVRIEAGEHREALEELEHFTPSHPDVDRVLRDLRREIERRREAQWVAEQTAAAAAEIEAGRFEDALSRLNRLPQTSRDQGNVAALLARAEAGAAAASEAQRERHAATAQLADAEAAANGWEPARTLAILETLEKRVKARADLQDLTPRIEQLVGVRAQASGPASPDAGVERAAAVGCACRVRSRRSNGRSRKSRSCREPPNCAAGSRRRSPPKAQERARDEAAQAAVAAARKLALEGKLDDGIRLLEQADTSHAAVAGSAHRFAPRTRRPGAPRARAARAGREARPGATRRDRRAAEAGAQGEVARRGDRAAAKRARARSRERRRPGGAREIPGTAQDPVAAGVAAGAEGASRSKTLWRVGGLASAIVGADRRRLRGQSTPPAPANPPVTAAPPPTSHSADHGDACCSDDDGSGCSAAGAIDGSTDDDSGAWRACGAVHGSDGSRAECAAAVSTLDTVRSADSAAAADGARDHDLSADDHHHHDDDHRSCDDERGAGRLNQRVRRTTGDRRLLRRLPGQGLQGAAGDFSRRVATSTGRRIEALRKDYEPL